MNARRISALFGISILALFAAFVLICCIALGPRFVARYVFWNVSDIKDIERFPSHEINNAPPAFHFKRYLQEKEVRSAFKAIRYPYQGNSKEVDNLEDFLESTGTMAFIVIKDDAILYEGYFNGYTRDSINTSFSMAKSFTSTLIGMAIDEGLIGSIDDPMIKYIPELAGKGMDSVTIKNLLMMTSGFKYEETSLPADIDFPWGDDVVTYYSLDLRKAALKVRAKEPPAKHFYYNNYHPLLLGLIIERTTKKSVAGYLEEKIWKPLGMEFPASWSTDSEESGFEKMESGINARAIDFAKFGRLFLNKGNWNGRRLVSEKWVQESTTRETNVPQDYYQLSGWWASFFQSGKGYYKYMWWGYARSPDDYDFFAAGHLGQYIYISPARKLIIVRHGSTEAGVASWPELLYLLAGNL